MQNETTNDEYNPAGPKVTISLKPRDFHLLLSATQVQNRAVIRKLGSSSWGYWIRYWISLLRSQLKLATVNRQQVGGDQLPSTRARWSFLRQTDCRTPQLLWDPHHTKLKEISPKGAAALLTGQGKAAQDSTMAGEKGFPLLTGLVPLGLGWTGKRNKCFEHNLHSKGVPLCFVGRI